jgi:hypothetical protein
MVSLRFFAAVATAVVFLPSTFAQAQADAGKAPRTPDGKPDLQGIWETRNAASFDVSEIAGMRSLISRPRSRENKKARAWIRSSIA